MEASIGDRKGNLERTLKGFLSSDQGLQLALVKEELRVIADQNAAVNTYLDLVHRRPLWKFFSGEVQTSFFFLFEEEKNSVPPCQK